jgi:Electron transfer DM13
MRQIATGLVTMGLLIALAPGVALSAQVNEQAENKAQEHRVIDAASDHDRDTQVLYSSTFWKKGANTIDGAYRVVERPDGTRVVTLDKDFRTKAGPDLKLVLSPRTFDKVTRKNALEGALVLGLLKSNEGTQEYVIPEHVKLDRYKSIAIHCEKYKKLWGAAPLLKGEVVASGAKWTKKTKSTKGRYEIVERADGLFIRFSANFKTPKPPEPLRILLSPRRTADASNKNAEAGAVFVALLQRTKGSQEYRLPDGIDLSDYRSVHLNCKKYTKLWSTAPLS